MTDYDEQQNIIRGKVRLTDKRGFDILEKHFDVHVGPPQGAWIEFLGIRIALRNVRSNVFDGIVPDFLDVVGHQSVNMLTTNERNGNDNT